MGENDDTIKKKLVQELKLLQKKNELIISLSLSIQYSGNLLRRRLIIRNEKKC